MTHSVSKLIKKIAKINIFIYRVVSGMFLIIVHAIIQVKSCGKNI